jgi:hypothetical protein
VAGCWRGVQSETIQRFLCLRGRPRGGIRHPPYRTSGGGSLPQSAAPSRCRRGLEILQVVVAVDVDELKLIVLRRVALPCEPLIEHQVVLFRVARQLTPDDERAAPVGRSTHDRAEPPGSGNLLLDAPLEAQPLLGVALKLRAETLEARQCASRLGR